MTTSAYQELEARLIAKPRTWLITGVAGFIGSNILERLLMLGQHVVGLDDFITGRKRNLFEVKQIVTPEAWSRFNFIEGNTCNLNICREVCRGVKYVLHQAALGSVPRSIADPIATNESNVVGFLNMLLAARDAKVERFVYAASSSTYGSDPSLPKVEENIGRPLSPYAVTKLVNELYAEVFATSYGFSSIGLRYFNVFGKRQDPLGAYAAVIPKWVMAMIRGEPISINGDGQTTRDFCFIDNAVQANLLAATASERALANPVYNIAYGAQTSLYQLSVLIKETLIRHISGFTECPVIYKPFREGDVRHSLADISKATEFLQYRPTHDVSGGIAEAISWYIAAAKNQHSSELT